MKKLGLAIWMVAGSLVTTAPAMPEAATVQGEGKAIVTVLPKKDREAPVNVTLQDVQAKVNGRDSNATGWVPLRGSDGRLELVVLMDSSARTSRGQQLADVSTFIQSLPADTKVALGYMENGRAVMAGPLSADHALVVRGLHLPAGTVGSSGGPYFCLSDLARHWPSNDNGARHEVLLITDGVDTYEPRYDPADPYVEAAMNDSIRAGLVVYSIYWTDRGRYDNTAAGADAGQNLLAALTQTTGGYNYWTGNGNPVSFAPFFEDLSWRLQNQYRLSVDGRLRDKPAVETLNLKVGGPAAKVYAPQRVFVTASGGAGE